MSKRRIQPAAANRAAITGPEAAASDDALSQALVHLEYLGYEPHRQDDGWTFARHPFRYDFHLQAFPVGIRLYSRVGIGTTAAVDVHRDFFDPLIGGPVLNPTTEPDTAAIDPAGILTDPPERIEVPVAVWSPTARLARVDFVARDAANRDLGRRGEEFVVEFERKRLHDVERRPDLARRVEWTARERGDGAGYDIASFNTDGSKRLIEVKTTGLGKYFPFNVTANEVLCSESVADSFQLYRVFEFGTRPRLYTLAGALTRTCQLRPSQYKAFVGCPE